MLKNVAALLKRRLKVKYVVLGSILHELNLLEFFPFRSPGAYIRRGKANSKMAFSEYKRRGLCSENSGNAIWLIQKGIMDEGFGH